MKITPEGENHIQIETSNGTFDVYTLVGGGLEIDSQDNKNMIITFPGDNSKGIRHVAFREE